MMDNVQEMQANYADTAAPEHVRIQAGSYFLELSLDWIVLRASENIHHLLGKSHVTLIDEPLGRFVHSQALHDLRNLFSRLSGTTGIGRAYGVRLTDERDLVDVAFQLREGRILLEALPSSGAFGEAFGTVGGLIAGLASSAGQGLLDAGARRMRALTGYDRVTLVCGEQRAESSRGAFARAADLSVALPLLVGDTQGHDVGVFPTSDEDSAATEALLCAPEAAVLDSLKNSEVRSVMCVPFDGDGFVGHFRCENRAARPASFELHAAAELFAQLFTARLEIDRLKNG
jgi:light-regulated signal transduction histidine kinase (bacteriophytochrome)